MDRFTPYFFDRYDPLKAGSIDGTDDVPHDKAIARAMCAKFKPSKFISGNPKCTVIVARLNPNTDEQTIQQAYSNFGIVLNVKIVRDLVTGYSKCYGFVEFEESHQARSAVHHGSKLVIDDHEVIVDFEKERLMKGWIPRRLGGGLGGKRESGQLRFGGLDRQFSKPIIRKDMNNSRHGRTEDVDGDSSISSSRLHKNRTGDYNYSRKRRKSRDRSSGSRNRDSRRNRNRSKDRKSRSRSKSRDRRKSRSGSRDRRKSRSQSRDRKRSRSRDRRSRSRSYDRSSSYSSHRSRNR